MINMAVHLRNLSRSIYINRDGVKEIFRVCGKGMCTIGMLYVASKLDVPLTISPGNGSGVDISTKPSSKAFNYNIDVPSIVFSRNSSDSAITSLMELGRAADWDRYKMDYVEKIFNIAKDCTDDNTKMVAVSAINSIANTVDWDRYKNKCGDYICQLVSQK